MRGHCWQEAVAAGKAAGENDNPGCVRIPGLMPGSWGAGEAGDGGKRVVARGGGAVCVECLFLIRGKPRVKDQHIFQCFILITKTE